MKAVVLPLTRFIVGQTSEECAEKSMTQNSKHNRFLSAPVGQMPIPLLPRSSIPLSCPGACWLCGCMRALMRGLLGWGVAGSLFTPWLPA